MGQAEHVGDDALGQPGYELARVDVGQSSDTGHQGSSSRYTVTS